MDLEGNKFWCCILMKMFHTIQTNFNSAHGDMLLKIQWKSRADEIQKMEMSLKEKFKKKITINLEEKKSIIPTKKKCKDLQDQIIL